MTLRAEVRKPTGSPVWIVNVTDRNFFNRRSNYATMYRESWTEALRDAIRAVGLS